MAVGKISLSAVGKSTQKKHLRYTPSFTMGERPHTSVGVLPYTARSEGCSNAFERRVKVRLGGHESASDLAMKDVDLTRISHHPLGGWIIGCELECFFLSVAFAVEPGPVGGWS